MLMAMAQQALLSPGPVASAILAWRPFLDPLNLHAYWWAFLPPLALGISIAYKAVRVRDLGRLSDYWRQVIVMTLQIIIGLALLGVAMFVFLEMVLPLLAPRK